jgi:hypothetical protein
MADIEMEEINPPEIISVVNSDANLILSIEEQAFLTAGEFNLLDSHHHYLARYRELMDKYKPVAPSDLTSREHSNSFSTEWAKPLALMVEDMRVAHQNAGLPDTYNIIFATILAIKLIAFIRLLTTSTQRQIVYSTYAEKIFVPVRDITRGWLHKDIKKIDYFLNACQPFQAPRGWCCSICLKSRDSHLTAKSKCNHYFHVGCFLALIDPVCPLCRGHIFYQPS